MKKNFQQKKGFTLIELLVVISIILLVAGMSVPAMSGFMEKRRVKAASSLIQMMCIETRARAIAQREKQYIVLFAKDAENVKLEDGINKTGQKGWIYSYDSNENGDEDYVQVDQGEQLPELTSFREPSTHLKLTFNIDGTIVFDDKDIDVVIEQEGTNYISNINIRSNTGKVSFEIIKE